MGILLCLFYFSVKLSCLFRSQIIFPWCDLFPFAVTPTLWNVIMDKKSYHISQIDLFPKIFFKKIWILHNVKYPKHYSTLLNFMYICMFNHSHWLWFNHQNSNLLFHYDISISNIYFNHLWLIFKKVSQ